MAHENQDMRCHRSAPLLRHSEEFAMRSPNRDDFGKGQSKSRHQSDCRAIGYRDAASQRMIVGPGVAVDVYDCTNERPHVTFRFDEYDLKTGEKIGTNRPRINTVSTEQPHGAAGISPTRGTMSSRRSISWCTDPNSSVDTVSKFEMCFGVVSCVSGPSIHTLRSAKSRTCRRGRIHRERHK